MTAIARETTQITIDDAFAGMCGVLRDALADAATARERGRSPLRLMRLATRCLAPLARLTRRNRALLPDAVAWVRRVDHAATAEYARATDQDADRASYLTARLTCQTQYARLAELQAAPERQPRSPLAAPDKGIEQLVQQIEAEARALQAQIEREASAANIPLRTSPAAPAKPITQRARWLAQQRAKHGGK